MNKMLYKMDTVRWIIVIVTLAILIFVSGCSHQSETPTVGESKLPTKNVEVAGAMVKDFGSRIELSGTVESESNAVIRSKVMAQVASVDAQVGQAVEEGDRLIRLEADEIVAQLDQLKANRELARIEYERIKRLREKNAATDQELDRGRLNEEAARAAVEAASTQLQYLEILAPFDGVVSDRMIEIGDMASPGSAVVSLYDPSELRVVAMVPESLSDELQMASPLQAIDDATQREFEIVVAEKAPAADPSTRTVRYEFSVPDPAALSPGQRVRIFLSKAGEKEIWIPDSSVIRRGQLDYVFRVEKETAWLRLVRIGSVRNGLVAIQSGLEEGDLVVTSNIDGLQDGQSVAY